MKKQKKLVLPPTSYEDLIVLGNLGLVHRIAQKYKQFCNNTSITYADLVQEGTIGLIIARSKFKSNMGARFSTYANFWIKAKVMRLLDRHYSTIHVTYSATAEYNKIVKKYGSINGVRGSLYQSMEELIDKITSEYHKNKLSEDDFKKFVDILQARSPMNFTHISLDAANKPSWDEETTLADIDTRSTGLNISKKFQTVDSIDHILSRQSTSNKLMDVLTPDEVKLVKLYFGYDGEPHTYKELAKVFKCSKQKAHQWLQKVLKKMREYAKESICYEDEIDIKELLNDN